MAPASTLHDVLQGWVEAGLLDAAQADGIERFEVARAASVPPPPVARIPLMTELVVYAGMLLTAIGAAVFVGEVWEDLAWPVRLVVGVVAAIAGLLVGAWLGRIDEAGARRLRGVVWLIGVGGVALSAGVVAAWLFDTGEEATALVVGLAVVAASALLWRNLDRPLQLLTTLVGLVVAAIGLGNLLDSPEWVATIVGVPVGLAVVWLAVTHRVRPPAFAAAFGAVLAMGAMVGLSEVALLAMLLLGIALATGLLVAGVRTHLTAVVVLATIGGLQFFQGLVGEYLSGPLGALSMMAAGGAVLVGVVLWLRHRAGGPGTTGHASGAPGAPSPV
jgi:hypothetical protein